MGGKLFGFASCEREVGAAEGMNVVAERRVPVPEGQGECTEVDDAVVIACGLRIGGATGST